MTHFICLKFSYITGDLDIHDIAQTEASQLIFVNTLFSCLATVSETHSFIPIWQPPFISKLAAMAGGYVRAIVFPREN